MSNLLRETQNILKSNSKTEKDILWVGSIDGKYSIPWKKNY